MLLTVKVLLTLATLGYSAIPTMADLNRTHATNPTWVGHARFHVVWQVMSYIGLGLLGLYFVWMPSDDVVSRLWIAAAFATACYAGFFTAVFMKNVYGGANYDPNGIVPIRPPIIGRYISFEPNITVFTLMVLVLAVAVIGLMSLTS